MYFDGLILEHRKFQIDYSESDTADSNHETEME